MKLRYKLFFIVYGIVLLTAGIGGFILTTGAADAALAACTDNALTANTYAAQVFLTLCARSGETPQSAARQLSALTGAQRGQTLTVCSAEDTDALLHGAAAYADTLLSLGTAQQCSFTAGSTFTAVTRADTGGQAFFLRTDTDLASVHMQQDKLFRQYAVTLLCEAVVSAAVLMIAAHRIVQPIGRLSDAARRIADDGGDHAQRCLPPAARDGGSEEIRQLTEDISRMARAIEQRTNELREDVERRDRFVGDFTHELKTPMTAVIGYADMLRSYPLSAQESREAADTIYREGQRLEQMAMRLLEMQVMQHSDPQLVPTDMPHLFVGLQKTLAPVADKKGIELCFSADPGTVLAEPPLLISLLTNLIDNACKASAPGQTVTLTGTAAADGYRLTVTDCGCGIPPESLDKLTDPFYMVDKSRARSQGGAGLGLALCSRIAAMHGTRLQFASTPGKGTQVSLCLKTADTGKEAEG